MALRSLKRGLGGAIDGVAAEYFVCDEAEAVKIPSNWDCKDGSTLAVSAMSELNTGHSIFRYLRREMRESC
jgi:threonine dehydrogenase-like Zn-dependent dehydrogenase